MSLTRTQLRARVGGAIGLSTTAGSSELALIDSWLDEAVEQFLLDTKCTIDTAVLDLTAGIGDYTLPTTALAIQNLWVVSASGTTQILQPVSTSEILTRRRYAAVGSYPMVYSLEGYEFLRIDPVAASSSDDLHFDYVPAPGDWSAAGNSPTYVPSWGHPAIEEYAKWRAADWDDDTSSKIGETYQVNYDRMVKTARKRLNMLAGKWGPAKAGRRRAAVPTSPGVDLGR